MSDPVPSASAVRRPRLGRVAAIAGVVLLIGIVLMIFAMANSPRWFVRSPAAKPSPAPSAAAVVPAATLAAVTADPVTLATRESALAAQLAALEARTATVSTDAAAASGHAGRAEAMLVAFAARRAVDRGGALGYLEEQLRQRFGASQPRAVAVVLAAGRQPVTLEMLRQGLDDWGPQLASGDGWLSSVGQEFANLVVLHRAGTPSPLPADRLARARRLLDSGQVDAALAEVRRLPASAAANTWSGSAQRYLLAHHALDALESAAILGQATPTPQPAPPAAN